MDAVYRRVEAPAVAGLLAAAAFMFIFAVELEHTTYDTWGAILLVPCLILVSLPFLVRIARRDALPHIKGILIAALLVKLAMAFVRHVAVLSLYGGVADAVAYDRYGRIIAAGLRHLQFVPVQGKFIGTGFLKELTGFIYAIIGPSFLGGFLVFAWMSFWGSVLWYRAFRISFPEGNGTVFAALLFFWPSIIFWPASIGKEGCMMLTIGIAVYGIAHLLRGRPARGLLYTILGLAGTALVRPHMSVLVVIAATLAYALRKAPPSANPIAPVARAVMLVLLIAASVVFVMRAATFFHVASLDSTEITGVLSATQSRSLEGHSTFNAKPVHNPLDLVRAVITVLFRPFPTEAHSAQMLLSSAESSTLLLLVVLRWRRVVAAFRHFRRWPFVAFAALYTIGFCAAFAAISNFGILARQRILVLPALFAILAVPVVTREAEHLAVPEEPQRVG